MLLEVEVLVCSASGMVQDTSCLSDMANMVAGASAAMACAGATTVAAPTAAAATANRAASITNGNHVATAVCKATERTGSTAWPAVKRPRVTPVARASASGALSFAARTIKKLQQPSATALAA
ncbi:hypothetical protein AB1Y20_011243 [Prymnesium parvum]|uniref:Secreted protein n=1 Tax=Prymnesium parvum TaxID=97485 RepID=A0AB34IPW1_PRYPA